MRRTLPLLAAIALAAPLLAAEPVVVPHGRLETLNGYTVVSVEGTPVGSWGQPLKYKLASVAESLPEIEAGVAPLVEAPGLGHRGGSRTAPYRDRDFAQQEQTKPCVARTQVV
jgi:hypothetical protein